MKFYLTRLFRDFYASGKLSGILLIICTVLTLVFVNVGFGEFYTNFFHSYSDLSFGPVKLKLSNEHWINDGLMTIFFLLVGLEIERELYKGELSSVKNALLPVAAAFGGMMIPALFHVLFNWGTPTQAGFGIPMATDIAFSLGILSLLGNRVPASIKIFLTALAIIDDLGAVAMIAVFYTSDFSLISFAIAMGIFGVLFILGKKGVNTLWVYLPAGVLMWYFMLQSGVHATITGVLLAFAIPSHDDDRKNVSYHLQHFLHKPVNFVILPIFAIANTGIPLSPEAFRTLMTNNSLGISLGLVLGKPIGILGASYLLIKTKLGSLPDDINFKTILGAGLLAGIGFTMSVFISNLAFADAQTVTNSKMAILVASLVSGVAGFFFLKIVLSKPTPTNKN
jgi:Na+:H+ antiporter, NhaA family